MKDNYLAFYSFFWDYFGQGPDMKHEDIYGFGSMVSYALKTKTND
jgi:hypothetical protein